MAIILIEVEAMDTVKVMISLPRELLEAIDRAAGEEHRSRSEFLREAARQYLHSREPKRPIDDPRVREAMALMDELARQDRPIAGWDASSALRRDRRRIAEG
jgi:metal-responsive CopG/Arc/MetJ family transcriptional regulator